MFSMPMGRYHSDQDVLCLFRRATKSKRQHQHAFPPWMQTFTCKRRGGEKKKKPSRRRTLGPSALQFAVVKFFHDLPLVPCRAMAVRVQLDLPLASAFAARVARVFHQIVVIVLIVIRLFKGDQSLDVCRHLEPDRSSNSSSSVRPEPPSE